MVTLQWFGRPYLAQHNFGPQEISSAHKSRTAMRSHPCLETGGLSLKGEGGMPCQARLNQSVANKSSIGPKIIVYGINT